MNFGARRALVTCSKANPIEISFGSMSPSALLAMPVPDRDGRI